MASITMISRLIGFLDPRFAKASGAANRAAPGHSQVSVEILANAQISYRSNVISPRR